MSDPITPQSASAQPAPSGASARTESDKSITITRSQFQQIAPDARPEILDALFAFGIGGSSPLARTLTQYDIIEPHVVAQFLTALSLASDRFTDFSRPIFGLSLMDWFTARAREWRDAGANDDASVWLWMEIIDGYVGTLFAIAPIYWNDARSRLAEVCAALDVEDESVIEDRGASEM